MRHETFYYCYGLFMPDSLLKEYTVVCNTPRMRLDGCCLFYHDLKHLFRSRRPGRSLRRDRRTTHQSRIAHFHRTITYY